MSTIPRFPVELRKMWSGDEVQQWLDENVKPAIQQYEDEEVDSSVLRDKLADILTRTANAMKGEPPEGVLHSWHDLPEIAANLKSQMASKEIERLEKENADLNAEIAEHMLAATPASETPRINIKLETHDGGYSICSTYIPVIRVEQEDDGSFTAVSNYWPETNSATVEAATIDEWCERIWPMFNAEFTDDGERQAMRDRLMQATSALASQPAQPECNRPNEGCAYPVCGDDCRHRAQPAQQAEPLPLSFAEDWQGEAPRTDALHRKLVKLSENPRTWVAGKDYVEMREHAETLERELQAANERVEAAEKQAREWAEIQHEAALEANRLRAQLAAQPQAVKWKAVDVRQALPVTDRQDVYPETRYVYKRLYERDEVSGYAWVELPAFDNDALLRALRNDGKEEGNG